MLRRVDNATVRYSRALFGRGRMQIVIGRKKLSAKMTRKEFARIQGAQARRPTQLMSSSGETYWQFQGRFYADTDGLNHDQVYALLVTRNQRQQAQIQRAEATVHLDRQARAGQVRPERGHIPDDVKHLVFTRDRGRCKHCGSQSELQFDHIIPVALGGGSQPENLQILCGPCNRRKAAGLSVS